MHQDEMRRAPRVRVCCRVDVRQAHGVWSAITEDLSVRGCRISTQQLPRPGARLPITLSSDLFPEELVTLGEVVWVDSEHLGVVFLEVARRHGSLSPAAWLERVMAYGGSETEPAGSGAGRVVPVVTPAPRRRVTIPLHSTRRSG